ncbi:hypothetical protein ILUMI_00589 [Ignelater luminosus]|uniref:Uncharacterized protein n=1 Tax=Ignelater luminosus TaxID=2038154 RepID=A0A8K0DSC7_IGNLU|nr:hypothetical protein ILUMI_00589 [Ignelater luminosus]
MLKNLFVLFLVLSTTKTSPTGLQSNYSLNTTNSSYTLNEKKDPTKKDANHTISDEDEIFDELILEFLDYDNSTSEDAFEESAELFIAIKENESNNATETGALNETLKNATTEDTRLKRAPRTETERPKRDYRRNPVLQG